MSVKSVKPAGINPDAIREPEPDNDIDIDARVSSSQEVTGPADEEQAPEYGYVQKAFVVCIQRNVYVRLVHDSEMCS